MTGRSAWAGIDLGTQSVRSAIFSDSGEIVGVAAAPVTSIRTPGRHEQDPQAWIHAVRQTLSRATADATAAGHTIEAVAVSGTSGTVVPVDDRGRPMGSAVMYDDSRGASALDRVTEAGSVLWSELGYRMQASWALPCLVAMLRDGTFPAGALIAHQPDVIVSYLTGERAPTDTSHALKTGADLRRVEWPVDVLSSLDLDPAALPPLRLPGEMLGAVSANASEATGLPEGCTIIGGMTDGCAAQIAAGALEPGDWNSVLGTTLVLKGASRELRLDPTGAVYSHRAPFGAGWWPGGASSTGAGAVAHWLPGEDLESLTRAASEIVPAAPSYPLTGSGERFPFVAPDARGFFAPGAEDDPVQRFAAIAHGVAFVERLSFDLLAFLGYDITGRIFATGGGSRNPWWVQLRADILRADVHVPSIGEGAIGMAILARTGATSTPLSVIAEEMLGDARIVRPRAKIEALPGLYRQFVDRLAASGWIPDDLADFARKRADQ